MYWLKLFTQRKITFSLLCQLCFNFLLYHKHLISNLKPNIKILIQIYLYIQIFSDMNIHLYLIRIIFLIRIYSDILLYHFFIRIYSDIRSYHFFIQIYSDIRSYRFLIRIYSREKICALKSPKIKWLKLFTHRLIYKEKLLPLCCVNYVLTFYCITHQNPTSNIKSKT